MATRTKKRARSTRFTPPAQLNYPHVAPAEGEVRRKNTKQLQSLIALNVLADFDAGNLTNGDFMVRRAMKDVIDDRFNGSKSSLAKVANDLRKHLDLQIGDDPIRMADFKLKVREDLLRADLAYAVGDLDTTNPNDARDIVALYTELITSQHYGPQLMYRALDMLGAGGVDCTEFRKRVLDLYPMPPADDQEVPNDGVRTDDGHSDSPGADATTAVDEGVTSVG